MHLSPQPTYLVISYELVESPDGQWGGPRPDGTVTGMIGQVYRREVNLAICEITLTGGLPDVVQHHLFANS